LFDITKNTIKKFILHTNSPNYEKFGLFAKCNFKLVLNNGYSCNADTLFPEIQKKLKNDSSPILNFETRFFGFPEEQIIFEVMKNDHIATLTICKFESNPKKIFPQQKKKKKSQLLFQKQLPLPQQIIQMLNLHQWKKKLKFKNQILKF